MKKNVAILVFLIAHFFTYSQNVEKCQEIVELTIDCINQQSSSKMEEFLSSDFSIAGQEGAIAKMVLSQLISQLGETVLSHAELEQNERDDGLELKYTISYKGMGVKEGSFVFNRSNELKELTLFKMEVKTMSGESEVTKSDDSVVEVPFSLAGKLILVDVILNGTKRKFILDNGAPQVILNSAHVLRDTSRKSLSTAKGVNGSISGMDIIDGQFLDFGGIRMIDQEVLTMDLSHLELELGYEFYGLIGFSLIKDYDILFDYESQMLTFIESESFDDFKVEHLSKFDQDVIPLELEGHIPIVSAEIDGNI